MITDSWGGKCPICGFNRMLLRYGTDGWYQYDACPKCGFAYGNNGSIASDSPLDVWDAILATSKKILKSRNLPVTRRGLFLWVLTLDGEPDKSRDTVFNYPKGFLEDFKKKSNFVIYIDPKEKERVIFT